MTNDDTKSPAYQRLSQSSGHSDFHNGAWAVFAFAICSVAAAARSRGFIESDGATHYLFARHALEQPIYFVDIWGRPLCTGLFAVPAAIGGLLAVRIASMLCAVACAFLAAAIARGQGFARPVLALIFTLGEPLLFLHSFSELTELPFAALMGLAFLCYQRRCWWGLALCCAIGPLGRPEGFAFLLLAAAALLAHRRRAEILILPIGLIAWSIAGHVLAGPADHPWWRWLIDHWPYESGSEYPRGPLLYFAAVMPVLVGPFALPAVWIGMWQSMGATAREMTVAGRTSQARRLYLVELLDSFFRASHRARTDVLMAALPLAILCGHSLLFWQGRFSSSGSLRYLLIVAPLWGCLAARGWEWVFDRLQWKQAIPWAALAVVVPGLVNYAWRIIPVRQTESWAQAEQVVDWYNHSPLRQSYPRIMSNHPAVFFYLNADPWDRNRVEPWSPAAIDHAIPGVLMMWDPEFCVRNSDPKLAAPLSRVERGGWTDDAQADWACGVNGSDYSQQPSPVGWHLLVCGKP